MNTKLSIILTLTLIPILFFASKSASDFVAPSINTSKMLDVDSCDFGVTVCKASYNDHVVLISSQNDLTAQGPIKVRVDVESADVSAMFEDVQLVLQGKTMYMGIVQLQLQRDENGWLGDLYVPFCTTEKMDWVLDVNFTSVSGERYQAQLEFQLSHF